ncbi:primosomal protein N' [Aestuariispira insulae]|uniref:Replication restart protein PriA n=1 Tax=Aestuariispira insulae TaxID=1461337 RepID=A0A3D9HHU0_9PROT|nr:primosomal protein N' [Aestuariispira insulae]RED49102.1 replication restart DNA helicase PriA [Aestuariispira insulae]
MKSQASTDLFANDSQLVKVLLPLPLAGPYDYRVPPGMDVWPGRFVRVPFGPRRLVGVVWGEGGDSGLEASRIKDLDSVLPLPDLPQANRDLVDWISAYCLAPQGAVLRMAMSVPAVFEPVKPITLYEPMEELPDIRLTAARKRVLTVAADGPARPASDLARDAGVSTGVVTGLADAGALKRISVAPGGYWPQPDPDLPGPGLSELQSKAALEMAEHVKARDFSVTLLDGVTGSGKTEVYFEAVAESLRQGRQVVVLLPEIALSTQWLSRFERRFGVAPAVWHSDLTQSKRRDSWKAVAEGKIQVLVGARSALHLPFPDLGLIVIDEEHDQSFKQEEGVIYNARDMGIVRGRLAQCPVILASATPSLETVVNVREGRFHKLELPERHGVAELPTIELVDILKNSLGRQRWISPPLETALKETLARGEQALLFLNRRGYAPLTLCDGCGHRLECPNCSAWLVEHRFSKRLECHHCGYATRKPDDCPECGAHDSFRACGPGVERLAEEVELILPEARAELVTSDNIYGPAAASAFVDRVTSGETNLIIGTQIVAKGYHFPKLTLVGVVDADLGLAGGDLRAAERTYQLLHQVAGRAGREGHKGRVLIQSANVDSPVMEALAKGDRDGFLEAESNMRELSRMPPFGRLAALIISGMDEVAVDRFCGELARKAPRMDGVLVLGPAPAPMALLRGRHRRRFLIKADKRISLQKLIPQWLNQVKEPSSVRTQIDIDPVSFM